VDQRPALDRMLKDAVRRRFDMVACWSVDRLGRSLVGLLDSLGVLAGCGSPDLSRIDLTFVQAYYALRQQVGEAGQQALKVEAVDFGNRTLRRCGVPLTGSPPRSASVPIPRRTERQDLPGEGQGTGPVA
jgi:Resolvase, N terminal domain